MASILGADFSAFFWFVCEIIVEYKCKQERAFTGKKRGEGEVRDVQGSSLLFYTTI